MIAIRLDGEPRGKGRPRFSRKTGHVFTPETTQNYEAALRRAGQTVMNGAPPLGGPLAVDISAEFSIPASWTAKRRAEAARGTMRATKRPDADNLAKMIDALNGVVWRDDAQITDLFIRKRYGPRPSMTVIVWAGEKSE